MKKVISILLLVVSMVMLMAGCWNAPDEAMNSAPNADMTVEPTIEPAPEPVPTSEPANVTPEKDISNFDFIHIYGRPGTYYRNAFLAHDNEYGIYRFDNTDVVVFHIFGTTYLVGEDTEWNGPSWMEIGQSNSQFLALSNTYMLFLTEEGKVAKALEEKMEERDGTRYLVHEVIPYEELPVEEQEAFVYPCSYEVVENPN